jgi:hypothetical protein
MFTRRGRWPKLRCHVMKAGEVIPDHIFDDILVAKIE